MKLRLLIERLTSTVYHATSYRRLIYVLKDNSIKLNLTKKSALSYNPVDIKKYKYYLSLSRTMNSGYIIDTVKAGGIVIELDGAMLSDNYKGKAVDWHGRIPIKDRRKLSSASMKGAIDATTFHGFYEAEDRLYSKTMPEIRGIKKYIKAIHAVDVPSAFEGGYYKALNEINKKFPIYLYKTEKDLLTNNKTKARKL